MSDDKPINAMYGSKMKLDLDKVKNNNNDGEKVETIESKPEEEVVDVKDSNLAEENSVEESEVLEEDVEVVEENIVEEPDVGVEDDLAEDNSNTKNLDEDMDEKDKKLANQSSELNYLTNKIIPKLKKENEELKKVKKELTDALEKSTRKYFDQLDINADLSNKIGKLGAEGAVNKVKADKLESELDSIKGDLESKINHYKEKLDSLNVE